MPLAKLGKRVHTVRRYFEGSYVKGDWVEGVTEDINIYANIQPATMSYQTKLLPEGFREKEAVMIYSDDWVNGNSSAGKSLSADVLLYRGAEWRVVTYKPYGNFGTHVEALAVMISEEQPDRQAGQVGVIN